MTTITLEIEPSLLRKAEVWAKRHQISLSDAISYLLQQLPDPDQPVDLDPWTQSLVGIISPEQEVIDQREYINYLEEKYS